VKGRLLAPGYYECTSETLVNILPAGMQGNLSAVPLYRPCGHRYQTGGADANAAQCDCGMYAVGACLRCGVPLCGEHADTRYGGVLCAKHNQEHVEADRTRAAAETRRLGAEWQVAMVAWEEAIVEWEMRAAAALFRVSNRAE